MRASETTLTGLIQGQRQFQVPLYQRTYSWTDKQLELLWEDVLSQAEPPPAGPTHFLGSVVLAPSPRSEAGFEQWVVVDGQQRLTSLSLALAALRDHLGETERINDLYLLNRYKHGDDRLRLLPTQANRDSYRNAGQCAGLQPGGEGPRGRPVTAERPWAES
ncbi:DUF262 domain-containing protein [Crossiella sp. S99.2]|uniref:DUF262 domain-containing protein n=1 Tax=Crossiella sp. S99.2 TaxID=2936272 RepID=UPI0027E50A52|nr:DUF262 domain-containing protein [Crossiella sp. S99.2]